MILAIALPYLYALLVERFFPNVVSSPLEFKLQVIAESKTGYIAKATTSLQLMQPKGHERRNILCERVMKISTT